MSSLYHPIVNFLPYSIFYALEFSFSFQLVIIAELKEAWLTALDISHLLGEEVINILICFLLVFSALVSCCWASVNYGTVYVNKV